MNHYEILELLPNASKEEIKKAHRRLARMYHPDAGNVRSRGKTFADIQQAYDILSDPKKRKLYDRQHGLENWAKEKIRSYQREQDKAQKQKKSADAPPSDKQSAAGKKNLRKPPPASLKNKKPSPPPYSNSSTSLTDRLLKVAHFIEKDIRQLGRSAAQKLGAKDKKPASRQLTLEIDALESLQENKKEISVGAPGKPRIVRIRIPAGVLPGAILRVQLPPTPIHPPETVEVKIEIKKHPLLEREGKDLIVKIPITVGEAAAGGEFSAPAPKGPVKVKIPPGWTGEKLIRFKEQGIAGSAQDKPGDLYVKTYVMLPETWSKDAVKAALSIESCYQMPVRRNIPASLK